MLNLFAASGHINYARSARIYIQEMEELNATNPWLQEKFEKGFHAVRRSARHWSGLWSDLVIEQTHAFYQNQRGFNKRSWNDGNGPPPMGVKHKSQCSST